MSISTNRGRWLQCAPDFFNVSYEINPWMKITAPPNPERARKQWENLHRTLKTLGARIELVTPQHGWPDMVFTANAGLVRGTQVVLARFRFPERAGEEPHFKKWFAENGFSTYELTTGYFEGEGDALFAGDVLFCGSGFRSDAAAYPEITQALGVTTSVLCELIDPRFYHLDTCFCPLNAQQALCATEAFSPGSLARMEKHIEIIPVPLQEAPRFACNAVVLGKDIVLPSGCDGTMQILSARGFQCHAVELDEFLKSGGAAKCLTLRVG